ncbi:hypothetical protein RJT34_11030 [Clitoria ternatea]|uniref:Uncharacterized protein n=1 Tax=Clitoria ternatea TaxID=43366 RepID=A0AAN9JLX7_CLITE
METMEYEERDDFAGKQTHTLEDVAVKDEVEATMDVGEASTSGHIWEEAAEGNDGHEQQEIFIDGMVDGLVEAKSSFPNLDIAKTLTAALDKMTQHWVTLAGSYPEVEMKVYKEGIMCGLQEASLSFPNMDKEATLNAVLNTETQSYDEAAMVLREYEGSDSEEEHESDHWQQEMRRILWEGMADGLLEAIKTFPALDIQTTIRTALNKKTWLPPNPQVEVNIYIKGIVKGLREAKLTFPTLDIQATLNVVLSRETHKGPPETDTEAPVLQDSWEGKALTELYWKLEEQYKALRNKLENGIAAMDTDSCTSNFPSMSRTQLDDELNSQSPPASNCRVMHSDIGSERVDSEYEKLAAILKGRAEDIGRLDIEDFRNSKEFQDELSAIYMNGLRDGLLEAKKATITPVFNENEELVTEEEAKEEDNVKDVDNENIKNIVVAAAKRTGDSLNHEMENLTRKTQLQEVEVERRTKQPNHETAIAEEEIAKFWTDYAEQDLVWGIDISRTGISTGASSSAYSFWESPPPFKTSARRSFSAPPSRIQTSPPPFKTSARRSFSAPPSRIQTSPPPFKTSARKSFTASPPWIQTLPPPLSPAAPVFEMSAWESFSASPSQIQISPPRIQIPSPPRALPLLK